MSDNDYWRRKVREGAMLSPIDRTSEVLFGLIMVLTFTGTISVASDGRDEVRELLWAAVGCNVAWGLVDAVMYWMNVLLERGHNLKTLLHIRAAKDQDTVRSILRQEIPPVIGDLLTDAEYDGLADRIRNLPEPQKKDLLTWVDLQSGLQIFLLVFLCTLPVAVPFAFFSEVSVAMRASNLVALVMLFVGGYSLARYAGFRPMRTALTYTLIGIVLVAVTMALGG
jgi:hypothetical protein